MIKSVTIENFQSHKHTHVDLVGGTNVIIGESDAGKSAVFRAINWVVSNRPLGDAYRSEWGGETRVVIETTDGHTVTRIKGPSRNQYVVNGKVLTAFGSEVPTEVTEVLRVDADSVQSQMDPPFLLSETPGEAARMLNRAASIEDIDLAITNLKREHSRLDRLIRYRSDEVKGHEEQMKEYSDVDRLDEKVASIEELDSIFHEMNERTNRLQTILDNHDRIRSAISDMRYLDDVEDDMEGLEDMASMLEVLDDDYRRRVQVVERAEKIIPQLEDSAYLQPAVSVLQTAQTMFEDYKAIAREKNALERLFTHGLKASETIADMDKSIIDLRTELTEITPDTCPLCGGLWGTA